MLKLEPDNPEAQINFGKILQASGDLGSAIDIFRKVVALHPQNPNAHCNLGTALIAKGQAKQGIESLNRATALQPATPDLCNNLGTAFHAAGELDRATSCYAKALELKHDWPLAQYNLGITRLLRGDFAQGWPLYESRFASPDLGRTFVEYSQPRWKGKDLKGRRILLHAEQAYGDTIQFIRYLPMVAQRGGTILLQVQPDLLNLMRQIQPVEKLFRVGEPAPDFDVHCPLLSLPLMFGTTPDSIPAPIPYLRADEQQAAQWRTKLETEKRLKVGLVWAGRPTYLNDRIRSISLKMLTALKDAEGVAFFSLQKGPAARQLEENRNELEMTDYTSELNDFTDTAALIENLDLVISVDTAVAHLAGAMGKQVWLMLPFVPDWRWMLNRCDSPWYPTMRLFRQPMHGDWLSLISEIRDALRLQFSL